MFGNLGAGELLIIAAIALVVLGPEKFPEYAKIAMRAYRDFRQYIDGIKRDMGDELRPVKDELQKLSRFNPEDYVEGLAKAVASVDSIEHVDQKDESAEAKPEPTEGKNDPSDPSDPSDPTQGD